MPSITRKRVQLPLTDRDQRDLDLLKESPARRTALGHLVSGNLVGTPSEAVLVHAVWKAGLKALEHQLEQEGYAAIAAETETLRDETIAIRNRRRPSWAEE